MAKLYVIAGHGAGDPGACAGGQTEAERVRALAARIAQLGGSDVCVLDTSRNWYADKGLNTVSLPSGARIIELHRDSIAGSARGAHIVKKAGKNATVFDNKLIDSVCKNILPGRSQYLVGRTDLANANRSANRGFDYRLLECGFISNEQDRNIFDTKNNEIAQAIVTAAGIATSGNKGEWLFSDWYGKWWYRHADGSCTKGGWEHIGSKWYLFDADGWMLTGWQLKDGLWYLLDPQGQMLTGWQWVGDKCYYLASDGAMQYGWREYHGGWYYCDPEQDGAMATNKWIPYGDSWCYCLNSGVAKTNGWEWIGDKCYYFDVNGVMAKNCWIGNNWVDANGAWVK